MPSLSLPDVTAWVRAVEPSEADRLCRPAAVDADPESLALLQEFGLALDTAAGEHLDTAFEAVPSLALLRKALEQIGPARRVRLIDWIAVSLPRGEALIAALLGDEQDSGFLRAEMVALHRRAVLARIFGADRVKQLLEACRSANSEEIPA
ncbi:hypothetical protein ACFQY5_39890 [Paeniroseomonas aquatica]|uniref:Uncharacterized protein n=1 Tax=Paeniroseomonas aquatica TaxID=373043 RepID=A0ABT8A025_9PROT|nr:hypothetical protein [Paeniroseomonas aquatica]MDN3563087.1 hypothetical protein [Paeniroseomonas aquatica]